MIEPVTELPIRPSNWADVFRAWISFSASSSCGIDFWRIDLSQRCENRTFNGRFNLSVTQFVGEKFKGFAVAPIAHGLDGMETVFDFTQYGNMTKMMSCLVGIIDWRIEELIMPLEC